MRKKKIAIGISVLIVFCLIIVFFTDLFEEEKYNLLDFPPIENPHILVLGFVDDKDDATTGPLKRIKPPDFAAVDGLSEIKSDYFSDCEVMEGRVILKPGPQAEEAAVALLELQASCPFDLKDPRTVGYFIDHDIDIKAEKATGHYRVEAKILNQDKKVVQGSQYKETYSFLAGSAGKIHVNMDNQQTERIDSGEDFDTENVSAKPFDLSPGSYLMKFQVRLKGQSRKSMDLQTRTALDFIDGKEL